MFFGWTSKVGTDGDVPYTEFSNAGTPHAGMMPMTPEMGDAPPHWMPYFEVKDCDAAAGRARELGAQVYVPPSDIPKVGRFPVIADPQGAVFAIFQLRR